MIIIFIIFYKKFAYIAHNRKITAKVLLNEATNKLKNLQNKVIEISIKNNINNDKKLWWV
jgi:hypothetical protein